MREVILAIFISVLASCSSYTLPSYAENSFTLVDQGSAQWRSYVKKQMSDKNWQLAGGFTTFNNDKSIIKSLNFDWIQEADHSSVYFFTTTLGVQIALITYTERPKELLLNALGSDFKDEEAKKLLEEKGLNAPVELIKYWIRGLPDPSFPSQVWFYDGQIAKISQHGLEVYYLGFMRDGMPSRFDIVDRKYDQLLAMTVYEYL